MDDLFGDDEVRGEAPEACSYPVCRVQTIDNVGGGRGIVAATNIAAGTLLMSEIPVITWDSIVMDEISGLKEMMISILRDESVHDVTKDLYPMRLDDVDKTDLNLAKEKATDEFMEHVKSGVTRKSIVLTSDEIVRIYLVLQHNGFDSGLYSLLTKINHSCSPNCIKFIPLKGNAASEIWSTRPISVGEEITISYCNPIETTYTKRTKFIESHHSFRCKCRRCVEESIKSKNDQYSDTLVLNEEALEETLMHIEVELRWLQLDSPPDVIERCSILLKKSQKLINLFSEAKGTTTYIKGRTYKAVVNCAALLLQSLDSFGRDKVNKQRPKEKVLIRGLVFYARNSILLLHEQLQYLGADHPDVATTYLDIGQALSSFYSQFPVQFIEEFPPASFQWAANDESINSYIKYCNANGKRVKTLYSIYKYNTARTMSQIEKIPGSVYTHTVSQL